MGDPLSDPRAARLLSASTGEIASLAGAFRSVGVQAQVAASGLRGAQNDASWTGQAASAFRAQVGKLPGQLDKVQHSYNEVATALYRYESALGPVQSEFRSLAAQLNGARNSLATAQNQLASARSNLTSATSAPHAKPTSPAVVDAHTSVANAAGAVGNLQGQVSGLESRGYQLLDEFDTVRGHARSTVSSAAGLAPSQSWLMGALDDVGNVMGDIGSAFADAGKFLYGVGKGIVDDIGNLPSAVENVWDHPGDLKAWGTLVKDVAVAASVVAMVAAPFAAPELAEADAAVEGATAAGDAAAAGAGDAAAGGAGDAAANAAAGASRFGTAMRGVNTWGERVSVGAGASGVGIEAGQGDWRGAAIDAGFMIAPSPGEAVTNVLGIGEKGVDQAAETYAGLAGARESVGDYQQFRQWGLNAENARNMAFDHGVPEALQNTNLDDPNAFDSLYQRASSNYLSRASTAMHVGKPVAGAVDKVAEKLREKVKDQLDPAAAPS